MRLQIKTMMGVVVVLLMVPVSVMSQSFGNDLFMAGIFDFDWGPPLMNFTIRGIETGIFESYIPVLSGYQGFANIQFETLDSECDATTAVTQYWNLRQGRDGQPPDGIIGARCSGASTSLSRFSQLEGVPMISPSSTSSKLSDNNEFPFFSRMVAPDDARGEVGALVAMLREFGWDRVSILTTDKQFSKDLTTEFRKLWETVDGKWQGEVAYANTIRVNQDDNVDEESVRQALREAPTDKPEINSRVVLLVAQNHHAYPILEIAARQNFQPDTIWVGPSSWVGRAPTSAIDLSWMRQYPGYLGVGPFQNRNNVYRNFMTSYRSHQRANGDDLIMADLPVFGAQMVDAIIAMFLGLVQTPSVTRESNGSAVVSEIRSLDFLGVSGRVHFTETGDLQDPQFSILHLPSGPSSQGDLSWVSIGETGTLVGSGTFVLDDICFPEEGCNIVSIPDDSYPVPPQKLPVWVIVVIVISLFLLLVVIIKYWRSRRSKRGIKAELESLRDSIVGMRTAETAYLPTVTSSGWISDVEQPSESAATAFKVVWCWKETDTAMSIHPLEDIVGDPADCWIKYSDEASALLEATYQKHGKRGSCNVTRDYQVDFSSLTQTKKSTGFTREVQRILVKGNEQDHVDLDLSNVKIGDKLPADIRKEPQMVLVEGDILQISKQRDDGWAFGTKLYNADEAQARALVMRLTNRAGDFDDINVFTDSGWFPIDTTRIPDASDLATLQNSMGDTHALEAPSNWAPVKDPSIVQQHLLSPNDPEYNAVVNSFMSTLQNRRIRIVQVERIQNLAMWQSYVVKRQTICYRETGLDQAKALQRFERSWLWHGTNAEVMDKILQQGFNRSFCGKNATVYGKGVYFARDAAYSSYKTYAVPDRNGNQYIMACRVVVGEYCVGRSNALTPDVRDTKSQALYDSTVGLLSTDTMSNPSIYVTYHDAQAYPEYLIKFQQS